MPVIAAVVGIAEAVGGAVAGVAGAIGTAAVGIGTSNGGTNLKFIKSISFTAGS